MNSTESPFPPQEEYISSVLASYAADQEFPYFRDGRPQAIVIGENHGENRDDHQIELIQALRPSAILIEDLGPFQHIPGMKAFTLPPGRQIWNVDKDRLAEFAQDGRLNSLLDVSDAYKIPLIGCDLSEFEMMRILFGDGSSQLLQYDIKEDKRWHNIVFALDPDRQAHMEEMILAYERPHEAPPLAIVGAAHAFNMKDKGFLHNYAMVLQTPPGTAHPEDFRAMRRTGSRLRKRFEQAHSLEIKKKIAFNWV